MGSTFPLALSFQKTGPSHWQDPDMMIVGMPPLTVREWTTHFSLWCISSAPLWIGIDITTPSQEILNILLNKEVIQIDQDPLGSMGILLANTTQDKGEIWGKDLVYGEKAILLFNKDNTTNEDFFFLQAPYLCFSGDMTQFLATEGVRRRKRNRQMLIFHLSLKSY